MKNEIDKLVRAQLVAVASLTTKWRRHILEPEGTVVRTDISHRANLKPLSYPGELPVSSDNGLWLLDSHQFDLSIPKMSSGSIVSVRCVTIGTSGARETTPKL